LSESWAKGFAIQNNEFPTSKESLRKLAEHFSGLFHPYCAESEDLHYLAHINTPNVARDIDLVRNLTGYDELDFWGFSYGTVVGAMYAVLHPTRVGKIVLDGIIPNCKSSHSSGVVDFARWTGLKANALDFEFDSHSEIPRILGTFASYCVQAAHMDPRYCPLAAASMNKTDPISDVLARIDFIVDNLTRRSFVNSERKRTVNIYRFSTVVRSGLMDPLRFYFNLADYILEVESAIRITFANRTSASNAEKPRSTLWRRDFDRNMTYVAITSNQSDPLSGAENPFVYPAVVCPDFSYEGIDIVETWVDHIHEQINANPLLGALGEFTSACLTWPNLCDYGVERYSAPAPPNLRNKILVLGLTNDPVSHHRARA